MRGWGRFLWAAQGPNHSNNEAVFGLNGLINETSREECRPYMICMLCVLSQMVVPREQTFSEAPLF